MGKTVPSYRIALEFEIQRWGGFRRALSSRAEKEAFDVMMDLCRAFASAGSNAVNPIIFEPMAMSILLSQQLQLEALEAKLNELLWLSFCAKESKISI